ncbi:MAG TPA: winged helix-turn-helix transcriptional regulator [Streptosporangiaceae bacterium]|jgi:DNA-binding HxlR family transcriptional regulator/peroxiredoxin
MRHLRPADADCAIAQALGVVGDWWALLVVRDVAGGIHRFDELQAELSVSRKVLAERLRLLVADGVLEKRPYRAHPPRFEYHLTEAGRGLLPVLVALQNWGTRYLLGSGGQSATAEPGSAEARRVHALAGARIPRLRLDRADGGTADPVADADWTVLYCFPGAYAPGTFSYPPDWNAIPGARGCTLESCTYRDRLADFTARGAAVYGVSTQRPDELSAFAGHARIGFPLLSDTGLTLAMSLRLPTFRAGGTDRLKRLTLVAGRDRAIRGVLYPVADPAGSVDDALALIEAG